MPICSRHRLLCGVLFTFSAMLLASPGSSAADQGLTSIGFEASVLHDLGTLLFDAYEQPAAIPIRERR
jgi:hypothetical protein